MSAWIPMLLVVPLMIPTPLAQDSAESDIAGTAVVDGLMWAVETNGENINWPSATEYCSDLGLGGHSDWRLPTIVELEALWAASQGDRNPIPSLPCCLWSSTVLEDDGDQRRALDVSEYAWGLYFGGPDRYYSAKNFTDGQALCARVP